MHISSNTSEIAKEDLELVQRIYETGFQQTECGDLSLEFLFPKDIDLASVGKLHMLEILKLHEVTMFGIKGRFTAKGLSLVSNLQSQNLQDNYVGQEGDKD